MADNQSIEINMWKWIRWKSGVVMAGKCGCSLIMRKHLPIDTPPMLRGESVHIN
jgi:hypothetical protein